MRTVVKRFVTDFDEYLVIANDSGAECDFTIERVMPDPLDNEYVVSSQSLQAIEAYETFLKFHEVAYHF